MTFCPPLRSLVLIVALLICGAMPVRAQLPSDLRTLASNPFLLLADRIRGAVLEQTVELRGRVRLATKDLSFYTDRLRITANEIEMDGRVKIETPEQDFYATRVWLDRNSPALRITDLYFRDQSRYVSARLLTQDAQGRQQADEVLYSTCPTCHQGDGPLPWQVYARRVSYDPGTEQIKVRDAQLVLFGVPVLRVPYWQLVNPAVKRLSGYLTPEIVQSTAGGSGLRLGQFWDLNAREDWTAWITTHLDGAVQADGRYRYADATKRLAVTTRAAAYLKGSSAENAFTNPRPLQGDIELIGDWFLNANWRLKGDGRFATTPEFGDLMGHDTADFRRAHLTLEYFDRAAYANLSLSQDRVGAPSAPVYSQHEIPVRLHGTYENQIENWGQGFWAGTDTFYGLSLDAAHRVQGRDSLSLSAYAGLHSPQFTLGIHQLEAQAFVIGGIAQARGLDPASDAFNPLVPSFDGTSNQGRVGLSLNWSTPLFRHFDGGLATLTPRVQLSHLAGSAPDGTWANENALLPYLSGGNLFQAPYAGPLDRGFTGTRADIGLDWGFTANAWQASGFFGARTQHADLPSQPAFSGAVGDTSVALLEFDLTHTETQLSLNALSRLATQAGQPNAHELAFSLPIGTWQVDLAYAFEEAVTPGFGGETWGLRAAGPLTEKWSLDLYYRDDLTLAQSAEYGGKLRYEDCCFGLNFYIDIDEGGGQMDRSIGFEIDLIDLLTVGDKSIMSF